VRLFHGNQFVVATCFDTAKAGTFTSLPEHDAEWKTTPPVPEKDVAADLGVAELSSQQRLVAGMLHPERLLNPRAALRAVHAAGGPWPGARPEGAGRFSAGAVVVEGPGSLGISERHGSAPCGVGDKPQEASAILPLSGWMA